MKVGDKVLCINDNFCQVIQELKEQSKGLNIIFPVKNSEYVVRAVFDNDGIAESILVEEIINPTFYIPVLRIRRELSFLSSRFRKLADPIPQFTYVEDEIGISN